jgi:hypothetical protein
MSQGAPDGVLTVGMSPVRVGGSRQAPGPGAGPEAPGRRPATLFAGGAALLHDVPERGRRSKSPSCGWRHFSRYSSGSQDEHLWRQGVDAARHPTASRCAPRTRGRTPRMAARRLWPAPQRVSFAGRRVYPPKHQTGESAVHGHTVRCQEGGSANGRDGIRALQ